MSFDVRLIAVRFAVLGFFCISLIGWIAGVGPFECCKRAVIGTLAVYVIGVLVIRAVNAIIAHGVTTDLTGKNEDEASDTEN